MGKIKENWQKRSVKNIIFFAFLSIAYFTEFPAWVHVQVKTFMLEEPDLEKSIPIAEKQVFVSDAELLNAQGENVLLSDFKGRPIFISFWASWCLPCLAEFPSLRALEEEMGDEMVFLFISSENQEAFDKYLDGKEKGGFYRQLSRMPAPLKHPGIPATFLIDQSGEVLFGKIGAADWAEPETIEKIRKLIRS